MNQRFDSSVKRWQGAHVSMLIPHYLTRNMIKLIINQTCWILELTCIQCNCFVCKFKLWFILWFRVLDLFQNYNSIYYPLSRFVKKQKIVLLFGNLIPFKSIIQILLRLLLNRIAKWNYERGNIWKDYYWVCHYNLMLCQFNIYIYIYIYIHVYVIFATFFHSCDQTNWKTKKNDRYP